MLGLSLEVSLGIAVDDAPVGETGQMTLVETAQREAASPVILVATTITDEVGDGETKAPGDIENDLSIEETGRPARIDVSSVAGSGTKCESAQRQTASRAIGWDIFHKIAPKRGLDIEAEIDITVLVIIIEHPATVRGAALNLAPDATIR